MDCFTTEQVRRVRRVPFYEPAIEDILGADSRSLVPQRANARGLQRQPPGPTKGYLSAEDLGILLQWHWKYGTSTFTNER